MPLSSRYLKQPIRAGLILGYGECQRTADSRWHMQTQAERIEPLAEPCCTQQHELGFDPKHKESGRERSGVYPMHSPCLSV
jgi:hypothetical protein